MTTHAYRRRGPSAIRRQITIASADNPTSALQTILDICVLSSNVSELNVKKSGDDDGEDLTVWGPHNIPKLAFPAVLRTRSVLTLSPHRRDALVCL